ncbi:MAG: uncharacterized protein QOG40_655 [Solirubrobacteraceae bacterium]|nr:uncharacterized protein [Solirubrobacteraceae bacterium]
MSAAVTASGAPALAEPQSPAARASCLYEGSIRHRRSSPADEFSFPLFMAYVDLDELPGVFDASRLWSARRPALAWLRRADYLGDPATPLRAAVSDLVEQQAGVAADGPIRLLTHLRYFGHCFNPVSFYYCYDVAGKQVTAVVAHVTNTPWGERHAYVMAVDERSDHGTAAVLHGRFAKALHVSPLMGMNHTYDWRLSEPGERLSVHIQSSREGGARAFDATLSLRRREMTPGELRRALLRYPALTMRLTARIYTHALRLRLRGASYHAHPGERQCPAAPRAADAASTSEPHARREVAA